MASTTESDTKSAVSAVRAAATAVRVFVVRAARAAHSARFASSISVRMRREPTHTFGIAKNAPSN